MIAAQRTQSPAIQRACTVIVGILAFAFFSFGLSGYFAIDDFYWLYEARYTLTTVPALLHVFVVNNGPMYRPLSQDIYFWAGWHAFSFNPALYLAVSIAGLAVFAAVLFSIYQKLTSTRPALLAIAIAGFSSVHFELAIWAAAFSEVAASVAFVFAVWLFLRRSTVLSCVCYVAALLSNETATPLPLIALTLAVGLQSDRVTAALKRTAGLWTIFALYVVFRVFVTGLTHANSGPFALVVQPLTYLRLSGDALQTALGWTPVFANVLNAGTILGVAGEISWYLCLVLAAVLAGLALLSANRGRAVRFVICGAVWFVAALSPLLLFSANNWSLYNLTIPLAGIGLMAAGIAETSMTSLIGGRSGALVLAFAALQIVVNSLAIFAPGGWLAVDGTASIERNTRALDGQVIQLIGRQPSRPLGVDIVSQDQELAATVTEHNLGMAVLTGNPDFSVVFTKTALTDPLYRAFDFNPSTFEYTRLTGSTARLDAATGSAVANVKSASGLTVSIVSVVKNVKPTLAIAHVVWRAPQMRFVEVHVNAPNGPLFTSSRGGGQGNTGPWVTHAMRFYLQDVTTTKTNTLRNTLAITSAPNF